MHLFYVATTTTISNSKKDNFWNSDRLGWKRPKEIALLIYRITNKKTSNSGNPFCMTHGLATLTSTTDYLLSIYGNSSIHGSCSKILNFFQPTVWKAWAPSKYMLFAWLVIQNRIWTSDPLERHGWTNCRLCPMSLLGPGNCDSFPFPMSLLQENLANGRKLVSKPSSPTRLMA